MIMYPRVNYTTYTRKRKYLIAAKWDTQTITSWLSPRGRVPTVAGWAAPPFPAIRAFNCFKRGSTSESNPHRWTQRSIVKGLCPTGRSPCQIVAYWVDYHFRVPSAVLPVPTLGSGFSLIFFVLDREAFLTCSSPRQGSLEMNKLSPRRHL
jgi:hypothetical protein